VSPQAENTERSRLRAVTIDCGAKSEAAKLGIAYTYAAPETFDAAAQQPVLSSVIAGRPQAIRHRSSW